MASTQASSPLRQLVRSIDGFSLATLRTLLFRGPGKARKVIGATLQAASPNPNPWTVSEWTLVRAFPTSQPLLLNGGDWTDGCTAPLERFIMALLLRHFAPKLVVEVGTYRGITTRLLLDNLSEDARIYTIDLPLGASASEFNESTDARLIAGRKVGIEYHSHPRAGQVTQILGNTLEAETWKTIPNGVDFAFIDASHSYEAVRNDTERVWPKLAPNAVVMWHDYTQDVSHERGVGQYIRELIPKDPGIFLCEGTDMAFRVPVEALRQAETRLPQWFVDGSYPRRFPAGVTAWRR
jgi:Methyltransferase domain